MKKSILLSICLVLIVSLLSGCFLKSDVRSIRSGMLKVSQTMWAFQYAWGDPERTRIVTFTSESPEVQASWSRFGGGFSMSKDKSYQEWDYERYGVTLLFNDDVLVGWKTDKSVKELKDIKSPWHLY